MPEWSELAWTEVKQTTSMHPVALLPLGAVEEHGPHLALGADWRAAEVLARRIAKTAQLLLLPALPYGQVWSLANYPGTLSISDETLTSLITDLGEGLRLAGVRGLVMLSGHLGNLAAMKSAARRLEERGTPSLYLFYPGLSEIASRVRTSPEVSTSIVHADEIETSIFLELVPDQVDMTKAVAEYPDLPADLLSSSDRWHDHSSSGVFGDATKATVEAGAEIVTFVERRAVSLIDTWRERHGLYAGRQ